MANAPGIGPQLKPEQALALEVTKRFAYGASRRELAKVMWRMHKDNMMLREALLELMGEDRQQVQYHQMGRAAAGAASPFCLWQILHRGVSEVSRKHCSAALRLAAGDDPQERPSRDQSS